MMSRKCFITTVGWYYRKVLQHNAFPLFGLQQLFVELNFPFSFLFLILIPEEVVNSFPKVSRKSGIYPVLPVLLMLTSTPVASVRNLRQICFLLISNSVLKTIAKKKIIYRRNNIKPKH